MRFLALLQLKHLENMTKVQERTISDLEDENVQLAKEHEERQLLWEQREVELERTIDKLEKQQEQLADAAAKFEEATGSIPDPDLPVANQLELAIRNIKEHIRIIVGTREESRALKKVTILKKRNRKPENKGLWRGECAKLWKALSKSAENGFFFLLLLDTYILLVYCLHVYLYIVVTRQIEKQQCFIAEIRRAGSSFQAVRRKAHPER